MRRFLVVTTIAVLSCRSNSVDPRASHEQPILSRPTVVARYDDLYGPLGSYVGGAKFLVDTTRNQALSRYHQCADASEVFVTDSAGIFIVSARAAQSSASPRGDWICTAGREVAPRKYYATMKLYELPMRRWTVRDTLWLDCIVHTGISECREVERFPLNRPPAG